MERSVVTGVVGPKWAAFSHDVPARARIQLLLPWGPTARSVVWFSVRRDGSVVVGFTESYSSIERTSRRRGTEERLPPKLAASLGEGPRPKDHHLTFHTSGVVNERGGARGYRAPITEDKPHQLCTLDFGHPMIYPVTAPDPIRILLPYRARPETATRGCLVVVPTEAAVFFQDAGEQTAVVFSAKDKQGRLVRRLQVSLFDRGIPWPSYSKVITVTQDAAKHGFKG